MKERIVIIKGAVRVDPQGESIARCEPEEFIDATEMKKGESVYAKLEAMMLKEAAKTTEDSIAETP